MSVDPVIVKARATGLGTDMADKDEKAARLAAQLRTNLKRRKEQARAVAAAPDTKDDDATPKQG